MEANLGRIIVYSIFGLHLPLKSRNVNGHGYLKFYPKSNSNGMNLFDVNGYGFEYGYKKRKFKGFEFGYEF